MGRLKLIPCLSVLCFKSHSYLSMLLNEALYFLLQRNVFLEKASGIFTIFEYLDVIVEKL